MNIAIPLSVFLISYIIGSFPTAYIVGKINHINIFEVGSGNMGANNIMRALGLKWAVLVYLVDSGKGVLAILIARLLGEAVSSSVIAAIAVVIGHNWSVLATIITGKLRGGKGVATACGTWLMLAPYWQLFVVALSAWGAVVLLTRYVSLGALVAVAIMVVWTFVLIFSAAIPAVYSVYVVLVSVMIYVRHWANIRALLTGRERRLGQRA
ncbi:MAG TPA: glycerol-3-phosphate 1-O-acyltransferase PlsY [Aggregatilineales bacterium]|nr:glycerol-3-phosphate 1-O-acyltransferase PlsY [Aggregatilineales bacterium]